jgi:hypothetical protein
MYDYARALQGDCVIQSVPEAGTEIKVVLPFAPSDVDPQRASEKGTP